MNKIWKQLYGLKNPKAKAHYNTKKECETLAKNNGFTISWDEFGRGKHRVSPDERGEGICYGVNDVYERIAENL